MNASNLLLLLLALDSNTQRRHTDDESERKQRQRQLQEALFQSHQAWEEAKNEPPSLEFLLTLEKLVARLSRLSSSAFPTLEYKKMLHTLKQETTARHYEISIALAAEIVHAEPPRSCAERLAWRSKLEKLPPTPPAGIQEHRNELLDQLNRTFHPAELQVVTACQVLERDVIRITVRNSSCEWQLYCHWLARLDELHAACTEHPEWSPFPKPRLEKLFQTMREELTKRRNQARFARLLCLAATNEAGTVELVKVKKYADIWKLSPEAIVNAPELAALPAEPPEFGKHWYSWKADTLLRNLRKMAGKSPSEAAQTALGEGKRLCPEPEPPPWLKPRPPQLASIPKSPESQLPKDEPPAKPAVTAQVAELPDGRPTPGNSMPQLEIYLLLAIFFPGMQYFYHGRKFWAGIHLVLILFSCGVLLPLLGCISTIHTMCKLSGWRRQNWRTKWSQRLDYLILALGLCGWWFLPGLFFLLKS